MKMAAKKRVRDRTAKDWPKPRARKHTPAADVRTGKNSHEFVGTGGAILLSGGHPKNTGGKKGRSGRKPNVFKDLCRRVIRDPRIADRVEEMLFAREVVTKDGKQVEEWKHGTSTFMSAVGMLASYVEEKPKATLELQKKRLTLEELVAGSYSEGDDVDNDGDDHDDEE